MTHHLSVHIMIHRSIVFGIISQICYHIPDSPDIIHGFFFINKFPHCLFYFTNAFRCIKNCWFVHIIPETFNSCICKKLIFPAKPFSRFRIQYIRKMCVSRPYSCNKITSVLSFTEIIVCYAFFIHIISFFDLHSRINNRDQAYIFFFQLFYIFRKITKCFIYRKVFIMIHIIDIHVYHVDWNMILPVFLHNISKIFRCLITPTALSKTESKLWSNITFSYHLSELFYNIIYTFACDHIKIQICFIAENMKFIHLSISDIKYQRRRIIYVQSKCSLAGYNNKIMRCI